MGSKKGSGADMALEIFESGPGEGEAIEGGSAAAHFVEEDEGLGGGGVEDGGGFGHFDHEGGTATGKVIGSANAGVDAVDEAVGHAVGGHKAAGLGEDDEQRGLAEVSGLAAHVGAGDEEKVRRRGAIAGVEVEVVRDE